MIAAPLRRRLTGGAAVKHDPNHDPYLPGEEWRPYAGYYEVSNLGRVRHVRVLVPRTTTKRKSNCGGYKEVTMFVHGIRMTRMVHRMVLDAFFRPKEAGEICRHLDGDKANNQLTNLRWGTQQENSDDRERHGNTPRGTDFKDTKLTEDAVRDIRLRHAAGGISQHALAREYGVSQGTVSCVITRASWAWVV